MEVLADILIQKKMNIMKKLEKINQQDRPKWGDLFMVILKILF